MKILIIWWWGKREMFPILFITREGGQKGGPVYILFLRRLLLLSAQHRNPSATTRITELEILQKVPLVQRLECHIILVFNYSCWDHTTEFHICVLNYKCNATDKYYLCNLILKYIFIYKASKCIVGIWPHYVMYFSMHHGIVGYDNVTCYPLHSV